MFQVLTFVAKLIISPGDINLGDKYVEKIGERMDELKNRPEEKRIQREQREWDSEKERIAQHSREVRAKWLK